MRWVAHNVDARVTYLPRMIEAVRLSLLHPTRLTELISCSLLYEYCRGDLQAAIALHFPANAVALRDLRCTHQREEDKLTLAAGLGADGAAPVLSRDRVTGQWSLIGRDRVVFEEERVSVSPTGCSSGSAVALPGAVRPTATASESSPVRLLLVRRDPVRDRAGTVRDSGAWRALVHVRGSGGRCQTREARSRGNVRIASVRHGPWWRAGCYS
jgi:hypothetical protein